MPLPDFATVHPTLFQTLQGSSGYRSLLDISFVPASHADGEGLTTSHVCLRTSGHPWEINDDHAPAVIQQLLLRVVRALA